MANAENPSPRAAVLLGVVFLLSGLIPLLIAHGLPTRSADGTPAWVGLATAGIFILGGFTLFANAAQAAGPRAQRAAAAVQSLLGFVIVVMLASLFSWVAFGAGVRHFTSSIRIPFLAYHSQASETSGRWMFGICAVLMWVMVLAGLTSSVKKWRVSRM